MFHKVIREDTLHILPKKKKIGKGICSDGPFMFHQFVMGVIFHIPRDTIVYGVLAFGLRRSLSFWDNH